MKRAFFGTVIILSTFAFGARPAQAASILYFADLNIGTDRMAEALATFGGTHVVTTAASLGDFTTQLSGGGFDLAIFFQQNSSGAGYDAAFTAIDTFVAGGGRAIAADWVREAAHVDGFGGSFTGGTNQTSVTVTDPSLILGIVNPVTLVNPGWGVFSTGLLPGTASCSATFGNAECAILLGNGGRTIFNGFLADTGDAELRQLYINEINAVFAVPEPATMTLLGVGLAAAAFRRRRR
jgi:hypothetical protein